MTNFPYVLEDDPTPRLGLVALQVDETIEGDFRRLFPPAVARLHVTRVPSGAELTPDTIAAMALTLPAAAALLPSAAAFDVVAYGCTSGTTLIGAERVHTLLKGATRTAETSDPLTAALAAFRHLGVRRVSVVSPYIAPVALPIRHAFEAGGLIVPDTLSFGEEIESRVARIAPASITDAARLLARESAPEALFLSCTNLRTLDILAPLERELDLPVLSSNQVLAWHMAQLAGIDMPEGDFGALLSCG